MVLVRFLSLATQPYCSYLFHQGTPVMIPLELAQWSQAQVDCLCLWVIFRSCLLIGCGCCCHFGTVPSRCHFQRSPKRSTVVLPLFCLRAAAEGICEDESVGSFSNLFTCVSINGVPSHHSQKKEMSTKEIIIYCGTPAKKTTAETQNLYQISCGQHIKRHVKTDCFQAICPLSGPKNALPSSPHTSVLPCGLTWWCLSLNWSPRTCALKTHFGMLPGCSSWAVHICINYT